LSARLAIEVDGESHDRDGRPERDAARDRYLDQLGFLTVRIPAQEVFNNLEGVVLGVVDACQKRPPPSTVLRTVPLPVPGRNSNDPRPPRQSRRAITLAPILNAPIPERARFGGFRI
jgi:hypothetical protein